MVSRMWLGVGVVGAAIVALVVLVARLRCACVFGGESEVNGAQTEVYATGALV